MVPGNPPDGKFFRVPGLTPYKLPGHSGYDSMISVAAVEVREELTTALDHLGLADDAKAGALKALEAWFLRTAAEDSTLQSKYQTLMSQVKIEKDPARNAELAKGYANLKTAPRPERYKQGKDAIKAAVGDAWDKIDAAVSKFSFAKYIPGYAQSVVRTADGVCRQTCPLTPEQLEKVNGIIASAEKKTAEIDPNLDDARVRVERLGLAAATDVRDNVLTNDQRATIQRIRE